MEKPYAGKKIVKDLSCIVRQPGINDLSSACILYFLFQKPDLALCFPFTATETVEWIKLKKKKKTTQKPHKHKTKNTTKPIPTKKSPKNLWNSSIFLMGVFPLFSTRNNIHTKKEINSLTLMKKEENSTLLKRLKYLPTSQVNTITQKQLPSLLHCDAFLRAKFSLQFHTPPQLSPSLPTYLLCLLSNMVYEFLPNRSFQKHK